MKRPLLAPFLLFGSLWTMWCSSSLAQERHLPQATRPPPNSLDYLVTGIALSAETVASPADMCPGPDGSACILERGLGLGIRAGYRSRGPWYTGGAYQFSRHESSNLLRLAIMQQLRGELRYYMDLGTRATPYLGFGLGAVIYGNEWGADTGGVVGMLGPGVELAVTQDLAVGAALFYRPMLLRAHTDTTGVRRAEGVLGFGTTHLVGLELIVELRDPLPRW
jgi:hypothetical protein